MRKTMPVLGMLASLGLSSCIPVLGGSYVTHAGILESSEGIHSLEMEQGVTVTQLYQAIMKSVNNNPKQFKLKANDPSSAKAVVWTFSAKYKEDVTFYAYSSEEKVYLGIDIGHESKKDRDMRDIYHLEDLVINNLN